jgi:hypothetical protein
MGKGIHPCRKRIPKEGFGGKYGLVLNDTTITIVRFRKLLNDYNFQQFVYFLPFS